MPTVAALAPSQSDALTSLRSFLLDVLPDGIDVIVGKQNRVPEPANPNFVVMSPLRIARLGTNFEKGFDVKFTGTVAGTVLTVASVQHGIILLGRFLYGVNVTSPTRIVEQLSGATGGIGTYRLSQNQAVPSKTLAAGYWQYRQPAEMTVQLDFHSADLSSSDMAQTVSTIFRSDYGVRFFAALSPDVTPLYADDPTQQPFVNDQQQYEWRWVLSACMQVNDIAQVGQQFADEVHIGLIEVDSHYPP
jgi:hypothetical protein